METLGASESLLEFSQGVHYFDGRIECPLSGVGSRGAHASNRIVIDDAATRVVVDRTRRTISVTHAVATVTKSPVADLMFLAVGITKDGARIPFAVHLKIFKTGDVISTDFHRHMRTQDELASAEFEPFTVTISGHGKSKTLLDPSRVHAMVCKPSLLHRVIKSMMAMRDHLEGVKQDPGAPGYRLADLSMGFGRGRLAWMMIRAKLISLSGDNKALIEAGDLSRMLADGAWRLELEAFTEKYISEVIKRDLFVFGLDRSDLLGQVRERGLAAGQTLAFRFEKGSGAIELGDRSEPLENAIDVARAYLEYHMLGGLLVQETERRIAE